MIAYRQVGWEMFEDMVSRIHTEAAAVLLKVQVEKREDGGEAKLSQQIASAKKTAVGGKKVGRNDPCPCGSGLKYKNCCGKNN